MKSAISVTYDFNLASLFAMVFEEKAYVRDPAYRSLCPLLLGLNPSFAQLASEVKNNSAFRVFANNYIEKIIQFYKSKNAEDPKPKPLYDSSRANCACLVINALVTLELTFPITPGNFIRIFDHVDLILY